MKNKSWYEVTVLAVVVAICLLLLYLAHLYL